MLISPTISLWTGTESSRKEVKDMVMIDNAEVLALLTAMQGRGTEGARVEVCLCISR